MLRWLAARACGRCCWTGAGRAKPSGGSRLTDYIAGRLERAMAAAARLAGTPVVLAGYCMGGTAGGGGGAAPAGTGQRRWRLLAAPWDFHAADPEPAPGGAGCCRCWSQRWRSGALPVDLLQIAVRAARSVGDRRQVPRLRRLDQDSERARLFVALEDWLNDGVPLAAPVARECLGGWYGGQCSGARKWRIAGLPVDPTALRLPTLVGARARPDRAARVGVAAGRADTGARAHQPMAGHIGMMAGGRAEAQLWRPLLDWLHGTEQPWRPIPRRASSGGRRKRVARPSPEAG